MERFGWPARFDAIRHEFGFSQREDERAARELARRLRESPYDVPGVLWEAERRLRGFPVVVLGAADEAARGLQRSPKERILVTADGATTAAREVGRVPDVVVTDLDGDLDDEAWAAQEGALVFVHAHGDNQARVEQELSRFPPDRVAGTCQIDPPLPLLNPGGFTDGDRACHLAAYFGSLDLLLVGFDYSGRVGRYTGEFDPAVKPRKLAWARRLIDELAATGVTVRYA